MNRLHSVLVLLMLLSMPFAMVCSIDDELTEPYHHIHASGQDTAGEIGSLVHGWSRTGSNDAFFQTDSLHDLAVDSDENVYAVGSFNQTEEFGTSISLVSDSSDSVMNRDGYIAKLNTHGEWVSAAAFTSSGDVTVDAVAVNAQGYVAVSGRFSEELTFGNCDVSVDENHGKDIFVALLESNLNCIWMNSVGGEDQDRVNEIAITDGDSAIYVAGVIKGDVLLNDVTTQGIMEDGFVGAFSHDGEWIWAHRITGNLDQSSDSLLTHSDGSVWVGGESAENAQIGNDENLTSTQDGYLLRILPSGDADWMSEVPGVVKGILERPSDSSIFVAGTFTATKTFGATSLSARGSRDIFISEYHHPDGFSGIHQVGGMDVDEITSIVFDMREHLVISGNWGKVNEAWSIQFGDELTLESNDYVDAFAASLDPEGSWDWAVRGTSNRDDSAAAAYLDDSGSLLIGGTFGTPHTGDSGNSNLDPLEFLGESLNPTSSQSHLYVWKFMLDLDLDGIGSYYDACEGGESGWTSNPANDKDSDGCLDETEDDDDDGDGIEDTADSCPRGESGWTSNLETDPDGDGCLLDREGPYITDDLDADGVPDSSDIDPADPNRRNFPPSGTPVEDMPLNASLLRINMTNEPLLPLLGDDAGNYLNDYLAWLDADGDGDYDLARSGEIYRTIAGNLEATPSMHYCESDCSSILAVGDVNGDGKLDLADSHGLHLNIGNGYSSTLDWEMPYTDCDGTVYALALGDLDGDSKADLITGHQGASDCIYLTSTAVSDDLFGSAVTLPSKIGTTADLAAVDFDLDGDLDILRLIKSSRLQLFFNPAGSDVIGSVVDDETLPIQSAEAIDIGDIDGDGDEDVVVATSSGHADRIYLNNQTGGLHNLTLEWLSGVVTNSYQVRVGDVDWDGDLDISIGSRIYLNPSDVGTGAPVDADGDGLSDDVDLCVVNRNYFSNSLTDLDGDGCHDILDDDDDDGDGVEDEDDSCPSGITGWTSDSTSDPDGDGCSADEDNDDDGDGVHDVDDICPDTDQERVWQVDPDGVEVLPDGTLDGSEMGCHPGESDKDHDGANDEDDIWPSDNTQSADSDSDGFGDNAPPATLGDDCSQDYGTSTVDRQGCPDFDNDGWSDPWEDENGVRRGDAYPQDPTRWAEEDADTDFDTIPDTIDDCPFKAGSSTEDRQGCTDSDGDGWSDPDDLHTISDGADAFPDDPSRHLEENTDNVEDGNNQTGNGTGSDTNGTGDGESSVELSASADMMMYVYISLGVVFLLLLVFVIFMLRREDDDIDDYAEFESEIMSDEEEVGGFFRKKKRKKKVDDHGLGGKKVKMQFGDRPGQRAKMDSGEQRHRQQSGYYGEETRQDSYFGGLDDAGYVGAGYFPTRDLRGRVGDDGYEWLEFPEGSNRWWWRERGSHDWSPWD